MFQKYINIIVSFQKEEKKTDENKDAPTSSSSEGATAVQDTASTTVPPGNPPPLNPYAMFNPAAMAMAYQGQMFPYPPNFMNPATGQQMGYNQQQVDNSQSAPSVNQSNPTTNSTSTNQEGSNIETRQTAAAIGQQNIPSTPELRQRSVVGSNVQAQNTHPVVQGQRLQSHRAHTDDSGIIGPLVLMSLITVIMFCLLLRRLYMTFGYKLDFDE